MSPGSSPWCPTPNHACVISSDESVSSLASTRWWRRFFRCARRAAAKWGLLDDNGGHYRVNRPVASYIVITRRTWYSEAWFEGHALHTQVQGIKNMLFVLTECQRARSRTGRLSFNIVNPFRTAENMSSLHPSCTSTTYFSPWSRWHQRTIMPHGEIDLPKKEPGQTLTLRLTSSESSPVFSRRQLLAAGSVRTPAQVEHDMET